jgi:hypothetical protein
MLAACAQAMTSMIPPQPAANAAARVGYRSLYSFPGYPGSGRFNFNAAPARFMPIAAPRSKSYFLKQPPSTEIGDY